MRGGQTRKRTSPTQHWRGARLKTQKHDLPHLILSRLDPLLLLDSLIHSHPVSHSRFQSHPHSHSSLLTPTPHSRYHAHTQSYSHSHSPSHYHSHSHSHSHSHPLSQSHSHSHSLTLTVTIAPAVARNLTLTLTPTLTLTLTPTSSSPKPGSDNPSIAPRKSWASRQRRMGASPSTDVGAPWVSKWGSPHVVGVGT